MAASGYSKLTPLGQSSPNCPYCNKDVVTIKGYRDCPHCGQTIHAMRRPYDGAYVMLTDYDALRCEEQHAIARGRHDEWLQERLRYEAESERLKDQLGQEPTDRQIKNSLLEHDKQEHYLKGEWGHYRNCIYQQADLARFDKDWRAVVELQSEVGYLDAAGPTNHGKFNTREAFIAPGCADCMAEAAMAIQLSIEDLESEFLQVATVVKARVGTRVQPATAWRRVKAMIRKHYRRWVENGEVDAWWSN